MNRERNNTKTEASKFVAWLQLWSLFFLLIYLFSLKNLTGAIGLIKPSIKKWGKKGVEILFIDMYIQICPYIQKGNLYFKIKIEMSKVWELTYIMVHTQLVEQRGKLKLNCSMIHNSWLHHLLVNSLQSLHFGITKEEAKEQTWLIKYC